MTLSVRFETKEDATVCGSCLVNTGREESCVYKMHRSWCQFYSGTVTLNQEIRVSVAGLACFVGTSTIQEQMHTAYRSLAAVNISI